MHLIARITLIFAFSFVGGAFAHETIFMYNPFGSLKHDEAFEAYLKIHRPDTRFVHFKSNPADSSVMEQQFTQLSEARPNLIYSWGTPTTLAISGKIKDIPIVFVSVSDPVAVGLVGKLAKPAGNLTGTINVAPLEMQLKTIRQYKDFQKLGMLYNPLEPNSLALLKKMQKLSKSQGFKLIAYPVALKAGVKEPDPQSIPRILQEIQGQGAQWLYLGPDAYVAGVERKRVVDTCWDLRLPIFAATEGPVSESKALLGLFIEHRLLGEHTARKAKLILEGKSAGTIPIDSPAHVSLIINLDVAEHLNMLPPENLKYLAHIARPLSQGSRK